MQIALYARVSTVRQADNDLSIPDQIRQIREWAIANGHLVVQEYIEPGASATDDKRPVFQKLINDALPKPRAFDAIVIHSLSRFFRDAIQFGVYERKLNKAGVKVISITQQTSDDSAGEMMRRIISTFDEYQSKENSKHTSRAMKENARQGFFNGSRAPYGYRSESTEIEGSHGRRKKKLVIDEVEADVVRLIYRIYLNGLNGRALGIKEIAKHLTAQGLLMRGKPWSIQKVHYTLSNTSYIGELFFNVRNFKEKVTRPPSEWVKTTIPAIIDAKLFEDVRRLRESRAPQSAGAVPKSISSPILLAGIIKCGVCGSRMSLATGKGGAYRYYKCTNRHGKGNHTCSSKNLPMDKVDQAITECVIDKVLQPDRLRSMMEELRKRIQSGKDDKNGRVAEIERQIKNTEDRQNRLLDAIESGVIELDETTHRRAQQLKTAREALLIQIAEVRTSPLPPAIEYLKPSQVDSFGKALRKLLQAKDSSLIKSYVQLLVGEVVVEDGEAVIRGSHDALAHALHQMKMGTCNQVPTFIHDWCARRDSNS
ncbi:MAG: recombinase family protein [Gammaproteobacteria bacterium]|nr:recombinase family protein [Gammaproteobacteria bacterium]MBU1625142.1 recombinase family protein [Gammaproteobacteria bacterium]MBU1981402.1 recombinase family protein [Gammaproteobacteria bacterium]